MTNYLVVIVGPTAIGKTALSIKLANYFDTEIVSTDSRQIFKEMSIGTAVPTADELKAVKHHFIQSKSVFDSFNVGDYELESINLLDQLFQTNEVVVAVGGSGLYVNALIDGLDDFPTIRNGLREEIIAQYDTHGLFYLQENLALLDPEYYHFLNENNPQTLQNPQRMMRFLEVCLSSGLPYSTFINKKNSSRNFKTILIGLQADREVLYQRINHRVDLMVKEGLIEEAKALYQYKKLNALQTVGYKELFDCFDGQLSQDEAIEKIKQNTRNFAKRQITWFKKNSNVKWFDYQVEYDDVLDYISTVTNG
jgi:tRNA dimethylallyltransferase